jgi:hypothetical protein
LKIFKDSDQVTMSMPDGVASTVGQLFIHCALNISALRRRWQHLARHCSLFP